MRAFVILAVLALFGGPVFADNKHDFDAAAALALAKAKVKHSEPTFDINGPTPEGYEKVSIDGGPWHFRKIESKASPAPEVARPFGQTFRHAGHNCPSCGYQSPAGQGTWIVRGFNADGTHTHTCPKCGQSWNH